MGDITNDEVNYITGMIPVVRGKTASLTEMVYGNPKEDVKPNKTFIDECSKYPKLLETALKLEGLICGRSVHASGVIIFDDDYNKYNCCMRAPKGQLVTQYEAHDSEYAGGLKYDFLTITNLDTMQTCLELLVKYGKIEWQGNLRNTFEKYFGTRVLDYDSTEMWEKAENLEIVNLFQFQTEVGAQAITKIKPRNLKELEVGNAVMRLVAPEGKEEQPIDTYVRYKNDIDQWYSLMRDDYHLTEKEIKVVEKHLKEVCGMATMQEEVMQLVMDEDISNFDMIEANTMRKSISKKIKSLQEKTKENFFKQGKEIGASENLLNYVWNECITPQLGLMKAQVKLGERKQKRCPFIWANRGTSASNVGGNPVPSFII